MILTIEQQIADAEADVRYHAKLLDMRTREVELLRAEKAKRDAEAKTVGQRVAEELVYRPEHIEKPSVFFGNGTGAYVRTDPDFADETLANIRRVIADAIDKAVADEREACAKVAESSPFTPGERIAVEILRRGK